MRTLAIFLTVFVLAGCGSWPTREEHTKEMLGEAITNGRMHAWVICVDKSRVEQRTRSDGTPVSNYPKGWEQRCKKSPDVVWETYTTAWALEELLDDSDGLIVIPDEGLGTGPGIPLHVR